MATSVIGRDQELASVEAFLAAVEHGPAALILSDEEALEVASLGKRVERALGHPQDIEWAIGPGDSGPREVFLLQTRPETVWSHRPT